MWLSFAGIIGLKTSPPALKGPLARDETAVPTPRRVIPSHFGTWPPIAQDAKAWAERVRAETQAEPIVLAPGQSYEF